MTATLCAKVYSLVCITAGEAAIAAVEGLLHLPAAGLKAVVAECDAGQFVGTTAEQDLADPLKVTALALAHAQQVEGIFRQTAVLPVAFGTVFSNQAAIAQLLRNNRLAIVEFLSRVAGHEEWALKAVVDAKAGKQRFIECAMAAAQVDWRTPPGARYFQEQALRRQAAGQFQSVLGQSCRKLGEDLSAWCAGLGDRPLLPRDDGRQTMASWSLLVSAKHRDELPARIAALEPSLTDAQIALELSGPWPAWSFVPRLDSADAICTR